MRVEKRNVSLASLKEKEWRGEPAKKRPVISSTRNKMSSFQPTPWPPRIVPEKSFLLL